MLIHVTIVRFVAANYYASVAYEYAEQQASGDFQYAFHFCKLPISDNITSSSGHTGNVKKSIGIRTADYYDGVTLKKRPRYLHLSYILSDF